VRLKKLTCGLAVAGLAAGMSIAGATHASAGTIYPYLDLGFGFTAPNPIDVATIGATNPGFPDSELCIVIGVGSNGDISALTGSNGIGTATFNGKVNGSGSGTHLDLHIVDQTLQTDLPACTQTQVGFDTTGSAAVATPGKQKGAITSVVTASLTPGIYASSITYFKVTMSAGVTLATPPAGFVQTSDPTIWKGPTLVASAKSSLNTLACQTDDKVVQLTQVDDAATNPVPKNSGTPFTYDIDTYGTWPYDPAGPVNKGDVDPAFAAHQNVASFNDCAQNTAPAPGKANKAKWSFTGTGTAQVDFLYAATLNPHTWDTTLGKCKTSDLPEPRVLTCKGNYGLGIAFAIAARGTSGNANDPYGLLDHGAVVNTGGVLTLT